MEKSLAAFSTHRLYLIYHAGCSSLERGEGGHRSCTWHFASGRESQRPIKQCPVCGTGWTELESVHMSENKPLLRPTPGEYYCNAPHESMAGFTLIKYVVSPAWLAGASSRSVSEAGMKGSGSRCCHIIFVEADEIYLNYEDNTTMSLLPCHVPQS
jgi:hypothetical protein